MYRLKQKKGRKLLVTSEKVKEGKNNLKIDKGYFKQ